jgi:imidazoleglycerol-phosphate dehydratase
MRKATIERKTNETEIKLKINLDGSGQYDIKTGIPFFDHMLTQVAVHGLFDLEIKAEGDLVVDQHHTIEDVALALGQAFQEALGDKAGVERVGQALVPMDEALSQVVVDLSGRPYLVFDAQWDDPRVADIPITLVEHFFYSFSMSSKTTLHARVLYGRDNHHKVEGLFKAFARALKMSAAFDPRRRGQIPSSKGVL